MAEYRLTPAAQRDLEGIWVYTRQRWGVEQANRYIDTLTATFAELAQSPKRHQHVTTFGQAIVAVVSSGT